MTKKLTSITIVYHKDTGRVIPFNLGTKGEIILEAPYNLHPDEYLVGMFTEEEVNWYTDTLISFE
jgi:hypothetical protein